MTKKEFVELFAKKGEFASKAEAEKKVAVFLGTLEEALLKGEEVTFVGFGSFKVVEKAARTGRNPKTGESLEIPARKVVKFKAGKTLAEKIK